MSWADALDEFEQITICHLDDGEVERRCIGNELHTSGRITLSNCSNQGGTWT